MKSGLLPKTKWAARRARELEEVGRFVDISDDRLVRLIRHTQVTSTNFDTVVALDFPHYCVGATSGCGGVRGWCYTFQGRLALQAHHKKVAFIDVASQRLPNELASRVADEIDQLVHAGQLNYRNLRFSGSGEVALHHVPFLAAVAARGVHLWGFSRNLSVARELRRIGAAVLISCDRTSSPRFIRQAIETGFRLAYTSTDTADRPPYPAEVVFPLHRSGTVHEVVDDPQLCPKVVEEFFAGSRQPASCQLRCQRCHGRDGEQEAHIC